MQKPSASISHTKTLTERCQFRSLIEDLQIAVIREKSVPLFARGLAHQVKFDHVLKCFGHSGPRKRELFSRCRDCDDRLPLKVLVNAQHRCGRAARLSEAG